MSALWWGEGFSVFVTPCVHTHALPLWPFAVHVVYERAVLLLRLEQRRAELSCTL